MTLIEDLLAALDRDHAVLTSGFHQQTVRDAIVSGSAVRVVPGVIATPAAAQDLDIDYVAATLLTGGVVAGLTAAMHHSLADGLPDAMELIVPYDVNRGAGDIPLSLWRTQRSDVLTLGVETATTASGAKFPITGPARTIVDLYRTRNDGYRQHARDALKIFLQAGGDEEELARLAMHFRVWNRLQPHLEIIADLGGPRP